MSFLSKQARVGLPVLSADSSYERDKTTTVDQTIARALYFFITFTTKRNQPKSPKSSQPLFTNHLPLPLFTFPINLHLINNQT